VFITFEGVDGCGKTTQVAMLAEALAAAPAEAGVPLVVREPGGTVAAERIRGLLADPEVALEPVAELLLFGAARADLVRREIEPALAAGRTVICDRFTDSTLAYQGAARGLGADTVSSLNRIATGGRRPDLTLYLRVDPATALARAAGGDRFESEGLDFQVAVARAYDEIAAAEPERIAIIDAAGTPEQVHDSILTRLAEAGGGGR